MRRRDACTVGRTGGKNNKGNKIAYSTTETITPANDRISAAVVVNVKDDIKGQTRPD
jgi:hypothetical protein